MQSDSWPSEWRKMADSQTVLLQCKHQVFAPLPMTSVWKLYCNTVVNHVIKANNNNNAVRPLHKHLLILPYIESWQPISTHIQIGLCWPPSQSLLLDIQCGQLSTSWQCKEDYMMACFCGQLLCCNQRSYHTTPSNEVFAERLTNPQIWNLAKTAVFECSLQQTVNHIVELSPLTKSEGVCRQCITLSFHNTKGLHQSFTLNLKSNCWTLV